MISNPPKGYLALPSSGTGQGILVLHAWWGLNDTIKSFCDRLADAGFVTFAPDLYQGKLASTISEAELLSNALDATHARSVIEESVEFLAQQAESANGRLSVVGFSLGAYFALELSNSNPDHIRSVVVFYGTGHEDYNKSKAVYLGHFAENDEFEPDANVMHLERLLRKNDLPFTFHRYSGTGHWFFEPDRSAYNESAANLAWDRTLAFLKRSNPAQP